VILYVPYAGLWQPKLLTKNIENRQIFNKNAQKPPKTCPELVERINQFSLIYPIGKTTAFIS
jgi:hypothetical protein